jgi:hypothetical protein
MTLRQPSQKWPRSSNRDTRVGFPSFSETDLSTRMNIVRRWLLDVFPPSRFDRTMQSSSPTFRAMGFSHITCLWFSAAATAAERWRKAHQCPQARLLDQHKASRSRPLRSTVSLCPNGQQNVQHPASSPQAITFASGMLR